MRHKNQLITLVLVLLCLGMFCSCQSQQKGFPFVLPKEKPKRKLSRAMERNYAYPAPRPEHNELYSSFKYTKLEGFDYNGGNATISRRDPSKIIFANGKNKSTTII